MRQLNIDWLRFTCRATVVQSKNTFWVASVKKTIQQCGSVTNTAATVTAVAATSTAAEDISPTDRSVAGYLRAELFLINCLLLLPLLMKLIVSRD